MNVLMILRIATPLVYAAAAFFAGRYFVQRRQDCGLRATRALIAGWLLHTVLVLYFLFLHGHLPVTSWAEALSLWMWMLVLLYLIFEWKLQERSLGLIVTGLVVVGQTFACALFNPTHQPPELLRRTAVQVHVFIALFSYTGFALSFVTGLLYLFLLKELKRKQLKFFFARLPALEFLDQLSAQSALVGLSFLTIGIVLGLSQGPALGAQHWYLDPKFLSVFLTWLIYAVAIFGRHRLGWWGKFSAGLFVGAFAWILFSFAVVGKFLSGLHSF